MTSRSHGRLVERDWPGPAKTLSVLGVLSLIVYGWIVWLSSRFAVDSEETQRPIILVLVLFSLAFLFYAMAIRVAGKVSNRRPIWAVVVFAVLFRLVVSFSTPIQEVDIYRYIWDGCVCAEGVSPFKFAPEIVGQAKAHSEATGAIRMPDEIQKLSQLAQSDEAIEEVFNRVHFPQVPTVYPPTSQAVFFATAKLTAKGSSVWFRVWLMKVVLIGFDLATLAFVIAIVRVCKLPSGLSVAYAWCPLLMKEVANSGHLDTIAIFLTTAAVYLLIRTWGQSETKHSKSRSGGKFKLLPMMSMTGVSVLLALAVGAKLYPIVLSPLVFLLMARRFGWFSTTFSVAAFVFVATTVAVMWPMLGMSKPEFPARNATLVESPASSGIPDVESSEGLKTFLMYWEMNDFLFLIIVENLKPARDFPTSSPVWFSVLPEAPRQQASDFALTQLNSKHFQFSSNEAPFVFTRLVTTTAFLLIALGVALRASRSESPRVVCEAVFLTLAWFWLLSPTQNPWYWLWALPFLPMMRNRAWFAVSGLVMVYYLRFWLGYHFAESAVFGSHLQGTSYFDFVVTWFEFGPLLFWIAVEGWLRRKAS